MYRFAQLHSTESSLESMELVIHGVETPSRARKLRLTLEHNETKAYEDVGISRRPLRIHDIALFHWTICITLPFSGSYLSRMITTSNNLS